MRMTATAFIFLFALLMIIAGYLSHTLVIVQRYVVVDVAQGQAEVLVHGRGKPVALKEGELVRVGDVIRTGPDSTVELRWMKWAGGMRIKIGPNTWFTVRRANENRSTKEEESRVRVEEGQIWVRLRRALRGRSKFEVETPTVVAAVRGTIFSVAVGEDGQSRLEVYEGTVRVTGLKGGTAILTGGSTTTVTKGQPATDSRPLSAHDLMQWQAQPAMVGPFLMVKSPGEGEEIEGSAARVEGRTEPSTTVLVAGREVSVADDGSFLTQAELRPGLNTLDVTARDRDGRETTVTRTVLGGIGAPSAEAPPPGGEPAETGEPVLGSGQTRP